jgi:D-alanyl-D-alanine carboxypeptidase (penicillin-binding protein 5/6)
MTMLMGANVLAAEIQSAPGLEAERPSAERPSSVTASAYILTELSTGKTLSAQNENERRYPASMTKILTALVALEYFAPDDIVTAGPEVNAVPADSSKAGISNGDILTVENLLRALIIKSGNEAACVLAKAVSDKLNPNESLSYERAEKIFCGLMNERAGALGASDTHFVNPHGYHNPDHYTTAKDMAVISAKAMRNPVIKRIASEREFEGAGSPNGSKQYDWRTHNMLLVEGEYLYAYATGIKTGFTDEAGNCLAASASNGKLDLIAVLFNDTEEGRWIDAISLFEFGFNAFEFREVQRGGAIFEKIVVANAKLGESAETEIYAKGSFSDLLSQEQFNQIRKNITYNATEFSAPVKAGDIAGKVVYTLNGERIYEDDLLILNSVEKRSLKSDAAYYASRAVSAAFSVKAIPFWGAALAIIVAAAVVVRKIRRRGSERFGGGFYRF